MATVTKTWVFNSNTENLALGTYGTNDTPAIIWDSGLSALRTLYLQSSIQAEEASFKVNATGTLETWESWGVPANSTVTSVIVDSYQYRNSSNTSGQSADPDFYIRIIDSNSNSVLNSDLVSETFLSDRGVWLDGNPNGSVNVSSTKQASTTSVRLQLELFIYTDGVDLAQIENYYDNIQLTIGYTPAASNRKYYIIT